MALQDINEQGRARERVRLDHQREFDRIWLSISPAERAAIEGEINRRLDDLIASPNPNWGTITNTSIEGGQANPNTGISGDWSGTVFDAIYQACGQSVDQAGMFFGNVWKMVLIGRDEQWVGIRVDPTFPQSGITLQGKSYFLDTSV